MTVNKATSIVTLGFFTILRQQQEQNRLQYFSQIEEKVVTNC